jgi:uncharacterized membrane protein YqjE
VGQTVKRTKSNGSIQLVNAGSTEVVKEMAHWNERYRHYRSPNLSGIWECRILKHSAGTIYYQFVDRAFEVARGIKATEAPIISVFITGNEESTTINYRLRQLNAIIICSICYLCFEVVMLFMSLHAIWNQNVVAGVLMLCAFVFLCSFSAVWLLRKIKHDFLTIQVFREILAKNWEMQQK